MLDGLAFDLGRKAPVNPSCRLDLQVPHRTAGAGSEAPSYEKIVRILIFLVEVSDLRRRR
jgi:hypothetical protein